MEDTPGIGCLLLIPAVILAFILSVAGVGGGSVIAFTVISMVCLVVLYGLFMAAASAVSGINDSYYGYSNRSFRPLGCVLAGWMGVFLFFVALAGICFFSGLPDASTAALGWLFIAGCIVGIPLVIYAVMAVLRSFYTSIYEAAKNARYDREAAAARRNAEAEKKQLNAEEERRHQREIEKIRAEGQARTNASVASAKASITKFISYAEEQLRMVDRNIDEVQHSGLDSGIVEEELAILNRRRNDILGEIHRLQDSLRGIG